MATSVKGDTNGGKEKRGNSPSNSILKKSSKPSLSSSSSPPKDENTSTPAETSKPVPNYLKPTMSSSLDFSRIPKKSGSESSGQKPVHSRRKSFDKPPPSSVVQRTFRGPPGGSRDIKPQRSTSFSNKTSNPSVRPASEKSFGRTSSLKEKKVDEQKFLRSKSVKKGTLSSAGTKKEPTSSSTSSTKKNPASVTSESSVEYDNNHELVDHVAIEDDLVNLDDHEVMSLPEMSEMPDVNQELADPTNYVEVDEVKHVKDDTKGSSPVEDHHVFEDKLTIADNKVALEDVNAEKDQEIESIDIVEPQKSANDQQKVDAAGDQKILVESAEDQQDDAKRTLPEASPTEALVEEKKEVEEEKEKELEKEVLQESDEGKDEQQAVSSSSAEAAAPVANTQGSAAKKDKQAYNDVIEETATKLMGGRKNKVLALAGAFETVISLQDTNKS